MRLFRKVCAPRAAETAFGQTTFAGRSRHTPSEMVIQSETQAKFQPQGSFQNAVGGKPGPPLPFGSYETGRSGDPRFHCEPIDIAQKLCDQIPRNTGLAVFKEQYLLTGSVALLLMLESKLGLRKRI